MPTVGDHGEPGNERHSQLAPFVLAAWSARVPGAPLPVSTFTEKDRRCSILASPLAAPSAPRPAAQWRRQPSQRGGNR